MVSGPTLKEVSVCLVARLEKIEDGVERLYNAILAHMVLNSPGYMANAGVPFSLAQPMKGSAIDDDFRLNPAIMQGVYGFFLNYIGGSGELAQGIRAFVRDLSSGGKIRYLWKKLQGSADKLVALRTAKIWAGRALPPFAQSS